MVDALLDVARNGSDADRLRAVQTMLDRVYGKPVQPTEPTEDRASAIAAYNKEWDEMTEEEQEAALDDARARWMEERRRNGEDV